MHFFFLNMQLYQIQIFAIYIYTTIKKLMQQEFIWNKHWNYVLDFVVNRLLILFDQHIHPNMF